MHPQSTLWQKVALRDAGPTELDNEGDAIPLDLAVPVEPGMPLSRPMSGQRVLATSHDASEWAFAPQAVIEAKRLQAGLRVASAEPHILGLGAYGAAPYQLSPVTLFDAWNRGRHPVGAPRSVRIHVNGPLPPDVTPTDIILHVLAEGDPDQFYASVVEFDGDAVAGLPGFLRFELVSQASLLRPTSAMAPLDETILNDARRQGLDLGVALGSIESHRPDEAAVYKELVVVNATDVKPMAARPDQGKASALAAWEGRAVHHAVVGGCVGGSLDALDFLADLVEDSPAVVPFTAVAASHLVHRAAQDKGIAARLQAAGVRLTPPSDVPPSQPGKLAIGLAQCFAPGALVMGLNAAVASAAAGRVEAAQ